ncbi:MAG: hypothetical protein U0414_29335 [Polyangiaceae bacterium]
MNAHPAANVEHQRASLLAAQNLVPADLDAMRAGRLSEGGARAVQKGITTAYVLLGLGLLVAAIGVGVGLALARTMPETVLAIGTVRVGWPALVGSLAGVLLLVIGVLDARRIGRAKRSPLTFLEGIAERGVGFRGRRCLRIGGLPLYEYNQPVIAQTAAHVPPGSAMRVYLTERDGLSSGIVVGLEPLPAPATSAAPCRWYEGKDIG